MQILRLIFSALLLLLFSITISFSTSTSATNISPLTECSANNKNSTASDEYQMFPLIDDKKVEMMMVMNETRRKLGTFQICAPCTCCGGSHGRSYCLPSPCCYAINCNIPNRPFGFCSFIPRTCHCFACHI